MNFMGIGPTELLFVVVVALIVLGPARMVEVARTIGKLSRELKRTTDELPKLLALEEATPDPPKNMEEGRRSIQRSEDEEKPGEG